MGVQLQEENIRKSLFADDQAVIVVDADDRIHQKEVIAENQNSIYGIKENWLTFIDR